MKCTISTICNSFVTEHIESIERCVRRRTKMAKKSAATQTGRIRLPAVLCGLNRVNELTTCEEVALEAASKWRTKCFSKMFSCRNRKLICKVERRRMRGKENEKMCLMMRRTSATGLDTAKWTAMAMAQSKSKETKMIRPKSKIKLNSLRRTAKENKAWKVARRKSKQIMWNEKQNKMQSWQKTRRPEVNEAEEEEEAERKTSKKWSRN